MAGSFKLPRAARRKSPLMASTAPQADLSSSSHGEPTRRLELLRSNGGNGGAAGPADFSGVSFIGEDLSGLDLTGADFAGADLSRADLSGANLFGANLNGTVLFEADLSSAELTSASLEEANLDGARLEKAGLGHASLRGASLQRATLAGATLTAASLVQADLLAADLSDVRARDTDLSQAHLVRTKCPRADLSGARIDGAHFDGADLRGSTLSGIQGYRTARWIGVDVRDIDFTGAYQCRRHIMDENYIEEFRRQSRFSEGVYRVWKFTSNCGRSTSRWALCTALIVVLFAWIYTVVGVDYGDHPTRLSPLYFSVVTMTTLGYGDVLPSTTAGQVAVMFQVITGYVMLGGLLSLFASKMASRAN